MLHTLASRRVLGECVDPADKGCLGGQHPQYIPLEFSNGLADHLRLVDKLVLNSVLLHLDLIEQRLLCSKDLHGEGEVFGQVHETAGVSNQGPPIRSPIRTVKSEVTFSFC